MQQLILLVIALPFISAAVIQLFCARLGKRAATVSVISLWLTFILAAITLWLALSDSTLQEFSLSSSWGIIRFDSLGTLMCLVISAISLIVHVYSVRYMVEEPGYGRFFILLDLMTGSLMLMVVAGDLITLIIAWHLVGILLYFLLGHDTRSRPAYRYAFWTWITYRFGDLPLVLAAVLLFQAYDSWSLSVIFERVAENPQMLTVFGLSLVETVGALIALAAFARSAQFFLHTWLPYTMSGPTPVSALMHAGIVNAGGFLINRFAPVYVETGGVMHWILIVGLVTAVLGSLLMLTQNDIKKALGYSTMGQMGFMIMECGVGAFSLAIYHLIAHGLFKGTMFLSAGGVIGKARKNDGVPKDDLYNFVVAKRPARKRKSWLLLTALTVLIPGVVIFAAHWFVAQDFIHKQGAVILLFFGWMAGAQLIFVTYHMQTKNFARLFAMMVTSFVIVVVGYSYISHAFDVFLYPDPDFTKRLYTAAGIDIIWFDAIVIIMTLTIVANWVRTYRGESKSRYMEKVHKPIGLAFYALLAREFYIIELYTALVRLLDSIATRLNVWLRWV